VRLVLDADVLIGALDGSDAHHSRARALFTAWHKQDTTCLISVINLSEVLIAPAADKQRLRRAREAIAALGVAIHQPSEAIAVEAARLRCFHPISLPDAYCLATARQINASIASFDQKIIHAARAERIGLAATPGLETPS
jgi:predicted nucleic acid-binding protein